MTRYFIQVVKVYLFAARYSDCNHYPITIVRYLQPVPNESFSHCNFGSMTYNYMCFLLNNYDRLIFSLPEDRFDITQGLITLTKPLQEAIDEVALEKVVIPRRKRTSWMSSDLQYYLQTNTPSWHYPTSLIKKKKKKKKQVLSNIKKSCKFCNAPVKWKTSWQKYKLENHTK